MKELVLNAVGSGFDFEDVDTAAPIGCEVLVDMKASGCGTPTRCSRPTISHRHPRCLVTAAGVVAAVGPDVTRIRVGDHV